MEGLIQRYIDGSNESGVLFIGLRLLHLEMGLNF